MLKTISLFFIAILLIGAVSAETAKITAYVVGPDEDSGNNPDSQMVGNDRDEHGCIGSAGYSWCAEKSKCLRTWEENCSTAGNIKILPETASLRAQEIMGLKCEEQNCTVILKEVPTSNGTRNAYEVTAEKQVRVLGFIKAQMRVQTQIDAESGELIQTKKPWWAMFAKE